MLIQKKSFFLIIIFTLIRFFTTSGFQQEREHHQRQEQQLYADCENLGDYYGSIDVNDRSSLHDLIKETHRNVLPYTSSSRVDVWEALIDIDGVVYNDSEEQVSLIYSQKDVKSYPHGTSDTWNREHVWPKSRGVGYDGADFTDLHHLRPADANVNSSRGNKFFGPCGIGIGGDDASATGTTKCNSPAHSEAAVDTEADRNAFLPPQNVRGDLARSLFYMALRYDGIDDPDKIDLELGDCSYPESSNNNDGTSITMNYMGYLSELLKWHIEDPVDEAEKLRNTQVCMKYQGNRNPFVDYPQLVDIYYGTEYQRKHNEICSNNNDTPPPPTPTTPPPPAPVVGTGKCGMTTGDLFINGFNADNPDEVSIVALDNLPSGVQFYMTDNAWTGTQFLSNEGTLKFTVPSNGITAGSLIQYPGNGWEKVSGSFALATSKGDNIMLYCNDDEQITHLHALTFNGAFVDASTTTSISTAQTTLPATLSTSTSIALPRQNSNYAYKSNEKKTSGTKVELLESLSTLSNWNGYSSRDDNVIAKYTSFQVTDDENFESTESSIATTSSSSLNFILSTYLSVSLVVITTYTIAILG